MHPVWCRHANKVALASPHLDDDHAMTARVMAARVMAETPRRRGILALAAAVLLIAASGCAKDSTSQGSSSTAAPGSSRRQDHAVAVGPDGQRAVQLLRDKGFPAGAFRRSTPSFLPAGTSGLGVRRTRRVPTRRGI